MRKYIQEENVGEHTEKRGEDKFRKKKRGMYVQEISWYEEELK